MEFSPLLLIFFIWLFIGLPISKMNQAKKKNQKPFPTRKAPPAQEASVPEPVPEAPPARETRLTPTVSVTVHDDSVYQGSMNANTGEGYDPCHEEDLAGLNSVEAAPAVRPATEVHALPFGWTGNDVVRGIMVSEILNRKISRRA